MTEHLAAAFTILIFHELTGRRYWYTAAALLGVIIALFGTRLLLDQIKVIL